MSDSPIGQARRDGERRINPYPEVLESGFGMAFYRQEVPGGWLYTVVVKGEHPALTTTFVKEGP